jgi:hypothetical protein
MSEPRRPKFIEVGAVYRDAEGRGLRVTEYNPKAGDGREVVGELQVRRGEFAQPYATSLKIFEVVWLNREPARAPEDWVRPHA